MVKVLLLLACFSFHSLVLGDKVIVFMGPPGSGKGTQSNLLSEELHWQSYSIGTIIRMHKASNNTIATALELYEHEAEVNDHLKIGLMLGQITQHIKKYGKPEAIILDAWPKGGQNLLVVNQWIFQEDAPLVIELMVGKEELIERAELRMVCPEASCGKSYGLAARPPATGKCDKCGTTLEKRSQERGEEFIRRVNTYFKRRESIFAEYQGLGVEIVQINGARPAREVHQEILEHVNKYRMSMGS